MEKLSKEKKDVSFTIDVRTIPPAGMAVQVEATEAQRANLANVFDIPKVLALSADIAFKTRGDVYCMDGAVTVQMERVCVVTLENFNETLQFDFSELFSKNVTAVSDEAATFDLDMEDEPIEPIPDGKIRIKEVLWEQIGLNLNPFPKKTTGFYEYREANAADFRENPFAALKDLIKS